MGLNAELRSSIPSQDSDLTSPCGDLTSPHRGDVLDSDGSKHGAGKLRYDLLPVRALRETVRALQHGLREYDAWGWMSVEEWRSRYYAALIRHIEAWRDGETEDAGSELRPLAHVAANALILLARELGELRPWCDRRSK